MKKIPDRLHISESINDKGMKFKGYFKVEEFDFIPDASHIERATIQIGKMFLELENNNEIPERNIAVFLSEKTRDLVCSRMELDINHLKQRALRRIIGDFLHSSVFNLRTVESIKNAIIIPSATVIQWWEGLPSEEMY